MTTPDDTNKDKGKEPLAKVDDLEVSIERILEEDIAEGRRRAGNVKDNSEHDSR